MKLNLMVYLFQVILLFFCITASMGQDGGSKSRFDKILQDFGFSGIGATQAKAANTVPNERRQPVKATPKPALSFAQRNRDFDIRSNAIPDVRPKSQSPKQPESSTALAALFSVAGKPTKRPGEKINTPKSRSNKKPKLQTANPGFASDAPQRKVNNRGLITNEKNIRIKNPGRKKGPPRSSASNSNIRNIGRTPPKPKGVKTLDVRKQLSLSKSPNQKFTSRGIPIVGSLPTDSRKSSLNKLKAVSSGSKGRSNSPQDVTSIVTAALANVNTRKKAKPAFDPVAELATIVNKKAKLRIQPSSAVRFGQSAARERNSQKTSSRRPIPTKSLNKNRGQINVKSSHSESTKFDIASSPKQIPQNEFNFDSTLKEFGFSPRLISGTSAKPEISQTHRQQRLETPLIQNKPFTVFPGNLKVSPKLASNAQSFTSKGIPIISSKPIPPKSGLNSLIALAGNPELNPVTKTVLQVSNLSQNQATTRRKAANRKGQLPNSRKSSNTRVSPSNAALGNLESVAPGKGSTFTLKNRSRGPSRIPVSNTPSRKDIPAKVSSSIKSLPSASLLINPFVNVNLQKQLEATRSQNANSQENNIQPSKSQLASNNEEREQRIPAPRKKPSSNTSRPKIFIEEEDYEDSFEEVTTERRTEPRRKEQKQQKEERRPRPKKNRPHKGKKQQKIEQRPPVVGGCFHVCSTLIFEVHQLLGGSLCDCVR